MQRDKLQAEELINAGWNVLVVWECELKSDLEGVADELEKIIKNILPASYRKLLLPGMGCFLK